MNFKKIMNRSIKTNDPPECEEICTDTVDATVGNVYSFRPGEMITIPVTNATSATSNTVSAVWQGIAAQQVYGTVTVQSNGTGITYNNGSYVTYTYYGYPDDELYSRARKIFAFQEYEIL